MPGSLVWFILVCAAMLAAWYAGQAVVFIKEPRRRTLCIALGVALLLGWTALIRHPATAVHIIPVSALARLEGVGAAPLFVFVISVGWAMSSMRRQRALICFGMLLGASYFVQGGMWMMKPTPTSAFGRDSSRYTVTQSQDYSCVPAASATALRLMRIPATEAEMAELSETREGTGATLLRAFNGLSHRLQHTGVEARLLEPDYEQLLRIDPPMLTPLQYEAAMLHMVTIVEVRPHLVVIADPQTGIEFHSRYEFLKRYRGQVIAFDGKANRVSTQEVLAQHPHVLDPDLSAAK